MKKGLSTLFVSVIVSLFFVNFAQAQSWQNSYPKNGPKYGLTAEDSVKNIVEFSLYREFAKQKNYADAYKHWRRVFLKAPKISQNIYIDGVKLLDYQINTTKDAELRNKFVDTMMMVYDQRIQYYNKKGYVLGRKGVDLSRYRPDASQQVYDILRESVELQGNKSSASELANYFKALVSLANADQIDKAVVIETYDVIGTIIDYNIKKGKKVEDYKNVLGFVENAVEPFSNCENLVAIYTPKFEANSEDVVMLEKITKVLNRKDCTNSELFFHATEKLHKLQPTAESAYLMGKMKVKNEDFIGGAKYLEESISLFDNDEDKVDAYYLLSNIYMHIKQFAKARNYALAGLKIHPNDGNFYITIGDMYAMSAKQCGGNDLTNKVAYWAAVDKYIKARNIDPSEKVKETANARISSYSKYFPPSETIFFHDLKEGDKYTVECWINETTTVRAAK